MKPRHLAWLALPALTVLAGCASTPPDASPLVALQAKAPSQWQRGLPEPAPTGPATPARAPQPSGDPLLPQLIAAAQQASPTVAAAATRIERARAGLASAAARALPTLDGQASASRARNEPRGAVGSQLSLGLQAGWEIDLFGGRSAAQAAAGARLQGAQAQADGVQLALAADTTAALVGLRSCEAQLALVQADSVSRAETARLTALRTRAGFGAPADDALASASAAQGRSLLLAQQARCEALLLSLAELTAIDETALRTLLASRHGEPLQAPALVMDTLPADLLRRRPDLYDAERELQAAARDLDEARAAERPQLRLAGSIGGTRIDFGAASVSGNTWSIGPLALTLPIFDGGVRRAQTSVAQAALHEAVQVYQAQLRRAVREVEQALLQLRSSSEQGQDARRAAEGFEAALRATEARQRGGLANLFELEDARRAAFAARSALIDLERDRALAWIDLSRALGGGWRAPETGTSQP